MRLVDVMPSGFADFLRGGREKAGEDQIIAQFNKALPGDDHVLLRHLALPGSTDKLGLVLAGPEGIWHLEQVHLASLVNNAGVWMHWDYGKQSVQPVPFTQIASQARSRLAELQAFLGPEGFGARQALVVTTPNAPRDFAVPGMDLLFFVDEIAEFTQDVLPKYAPETPLAVAEVVDLLTGKTQAKGAAAAEAPSSGGAPWLNQRYPRLGSLTGLQILVLTLATVANCCLLAILAVLLLSP
ncbi:MAG: hypothetical protein JNK29_16645 [Anaerolineales bacterium]|nr:hypothetical protein [Anaerolineales bacterium]